jgi:transposase
VLQHHFNWKTLSVIAGITFWNFYFRLFPGSIKTPQVIEFLEHLLRHLPGNVLVIWDGLSAHRSRLVRDFVARQNGRLELEFLPAYAPELNPTEYIWGHLKSHELTGLCAQDLGHLSVQAIRALKRMRRRPALIIAFWTQAELFPL